MGATFGTVCRKAGWNGRQDILCIFCRCVRLLKPENFHEETTLEKARHMACPSRVSSGNLRASTSSGLEARFLLAGAGFHGNRKSHEEKRDEQWMEQMGCGGNGGDLRSGDVGVQMGDGSGIQKEKGVLGVHEGGSPGPIPDVD